MHWSCLNSRRIPNKVVSCANTALEEHPERRRQPGILPEVSMSYLLPGCQRDIAIMLCSGGCREGGAAAGRSLFWGFFPDSLGASAGMEKTRCRTVSITHIRAMEHTALEVFSRPGPSSLSLIEALLRKHAELTFRLLGCKFVRGAFVLVPESGACSWAVSFGKLRRLSRVIDGDSRGGSVKRMQTVLRRFKKRSSKEIALVTATL